MRVFEFAYTDCIYESAAATLSIHRTRKGAEMALGFHKENERRLWMDMYTNDYERQRFPFGKMKDWIIRETEVEE